MSEPKKALIYSEETEDVSAGEPRLADIKEELTTIKEQIEEKVEQADKVGLQDLAELADSHGNHIELLQSSINKIKKKLDDFLATTEEELASKWQNQMQLHEQRFDLMQSSIDKLKKAVREAAQKPVVQDAVRIEDNVAPVAPVKVRSGGQRFYIGRLA